MPVSLRKGKICSGCHKTFTSIYRHWGRTNQSTCKEAERKSRRRAFENLQLGSDSDSNSTNNESIHKDKTEQSQSIIGNVPPPTPPSLDVFYDENIKILQTDDPLLLGTQIADFDGSDQEDDEPDEEIGDEEEEEEESAELLAELERAWEPPRPLDVSIAEPLSYENPDEADNTGSAAIPPRCLVEEPLHRPPTCIVKYPGRAGEVTSTRHECPYETYRNGVSGHPIWAPFVSQTDWEVAQWAKQCGPSSTALTDLLSIPGLVDKLGLSYRNAKQLNTIIDKLPSSRPAFVRSEFRIQGEVVELYSRDIIGCVRSLYEDPKFTEHLTFAPEKHFADKDKTNRLYHEMYTGHWWWKTQTEVESKTPGATIIPLIFSSDKTQLTLFRGKVAYPVYMSIGNLPKHTRRKPSMGGFVLVGYLPTSKLEHITNKASRRRALANLFHTCMAHIMQPLIRAGAEGIFMTSGNQTRRCHPIYAAYISDYPEQMLIELLKNGECAYCPVPRGDLETTDVYEFRPMEPVLQALSLADDPDPLLFTKACSSAGIKPVPHPFWERLPYANVFRSMMPDILHQLHQGVLKHLKAWIIQACGVAEVDARCRRFPPNHHIHQFMKGITSLSRVSGKEHAQINQVLLGLVLGIRLPNNMSNVHLVRATRALLDFLYLSHYPVHSNSSIQLLHDALQRFHDNKSIFIDLGIRRDFEIPKLHHLWHHTDLIQFFGTDDNFNTEQTERLHIDYAKDAYRATNHKDEFRQMTIWLQRKERIQRYQDYVTWSIAQLEQNTPLTRSPATHLNQFSDGRILHMSKGPTKKSISFTTIINPDYYNATFFTQALHRFVAKLNKPNSTPAELEELADQTHITFHQVPVFHRIKWISSNTLQTVDSVHVDPPRITKRGCALPGRFDTVLINNGEESEFAVKEHRIGQVRVIFTIPEKYHPDLFSPGIKPPQHLAYIEWFSIFPNSVDPNHRCYKITRPAEKSRRIASVEPVASIRGSTHLFPDFGPAAPPQWTMSSVLDQCEIFYTNSFSSRYIYTLLS